jgi:4-hydroxy-tetrahydrodipicolinate reductase
MKDKPIHVAIPGCAGRMGQALVRAVVGSGDMKLTGASEAPGSEAVGQDAGSVAGLSPQAVTVTDDPSALFDGAEAVIDFTLPHVTETLAPHYGSNRLATVVGTTGLSEQQLAGLAKAAARTPVVFSPNMSVGINVLFHLAAETARMLGEGYHLEILEAHHGLKVDAPSGTALCLAHLLAEATPAAGDLEPRAVYGRQGTVGPRPPDQIGIHTIRGGDIVGEHTVMYCGQGERLELTHRASSRQTFAQGALRALRWVIDQPPGLYDMQDVLGFARGA